MSEPWQVRVYEHQQLVYTVECPGAVELGRQSEGERKPYFHVPEAGHWRVVLAGLDENEVSRKHVRVEPLPQSRARVTNQSRKLSVRFPDGSELGRDSSRDMALPVTLLVGSRVVLIEPVAVAPSELYSLADAPQPPGAEMDNRSRFSTIAAVPGMPEEWLVRWLQGAMDLLHSAASSADFFDRAAGALVDIVGLDAGRVLLLESEAWRVHTQKKAAHLPPGDGELSRRVLARVREEKRTFWEAPPGDAASLEGVNAVVVAPILDRRGEVVGVLYGERVRDSGGTPAGGRPILRLEAMLVELLASGVAAGLARMEQEQAALEAQRTGMRMERDLEIGRNIQVGFLPEELPRVAGWEVATHFRPAREVSGDFYDVFALPHDHLALVIADVCDKGVGAALYMTLFRSLLRAFALQTVGHRLFGWGAQLSSTAVGDAARRRAALLADLTALSTVELTNNYVAQTHASAYMFASLFFGVLHVTTGTLSYVNAGHDPPILLGPSGVRGRLDPTGSVVGIRPNIAYDVHRILLEPGDALVAYTDGVTEARDPTGQFFTEKRLLSLLDGPARPAATLLTDVVSSLREHVAGAEPYDDVTLLAVRRLP